MAFTLFTPVTTIVEAQDAMGLRIYDASTWTGETALCTTCTVSIAYTDGDEVVTTYDDYELIPAAVRTKFNEYLSSDGHLIDIADLTIAAVAAPDVFSDGYYEITVTYNDGTYGAGSEPYYVNSQAFLAKYRMMKRTMPALLMTWPITVVMREIVYDIYTLGLYLDAAEDAADLSKKVEFRKFIALIEQVVDNYVIPEPW